jgi:hypothetical protein
LSIKALYFPMPALYGTMRICPTMRYSCLANGVFLLSARRIDVDPLCHGSSLLEPP